MVYKKTISQKFHVVALWITISGLLLIIATGDCTVINAGVQQRTFYVDATRGNDNQDGLTPEKAWCSLEMVNQVSLQPGDRVLFRRGDVWRGQLVPQSGNITGVVYYGAFGNGAKPLLLGSLSKNHPEDWQSVGSNLWATVPLRFEPEEVLVDLQKRRWSLHQEGGASCTFTPLPSDSKEYPAYRLECRRSGTKSNHIQLSAPGISARKGEYYLMTLHVQANQPVTLNRIVLMKSGSPWTTYATSGSDLAVSNNWKEYTIHFHCIRTALDTRLTLYLGGMLPVDTTLLFRPGKLMKATCSQSDPLSIDVGNIIFDQGRVTGIKKWKTADLRQEGDFFYDPRNWQVILLSNGNPPTLYRSIEFALRRHIINQGGCGYVTYENLALSCGAAHGIGGGSTHNITVRNCDVSYIGGGHQFTHPGGKPVRFGNGIEFWSTARDCLVEGCRLWEIYDAALSNQGGGTNVQENITYRNNIIWNSEYSFEFWNRDQASLTRNIRFEHNTCVDAGYGWGHCQRPDINGRHIMFYNNSSVTEKFFIRYNIFCNSKDSCLRKHGRDWTSALTMDYNCWFQRQGPIILWDKDTVDAGGFAAFQQKRGLDTHSIVADPKFVNPAGNDYRLAPDSPARALLDNGIPAGAIP
ncbi:MAG: hypothetical protein PHR77_13770 [Kiritimatiellae bacterium]|nr:hypothetical protein [Kiritimatiellia bacterium]MDD5519711.1 hypothetical protein [Kiritimatiellia bacterium]